jgi:hypothetical protein
MEPRCTKGVEGSDLATTPEPLDQCPETAHLAEEHTGLSRVILPSLAVSHMLVRPDSAHRAALLQLPYRSSVSCGSRAELLFRFHGWTLVDGVPDFIPHHQLEPSQSLNNASFDCGHSCRWSVHYLADRSYLVLCDLSGRKLQVRWLHWFTGEA